MSSSNTNKKTSSSSGDNTNPLELSSEPLVFHYDLPCRFVAHHDPLSPLLWFCFHKSSRCPHLRSNNAALVADYSKCFIVETRCRQRLAHALPDTFDRDKDELPLTNDEACDGEDEVSVRLNEHALRFMMDRSALRFIPFDFERSFGFALERAAATPEYLAHELAESLLPLVCVRTPLLWVMLATPVRDVPCERDWIECAATSFFLFERYRHMIYTLERAAQNQTMVPEIKRNIEAQQRDGSDPPQLQPRIPERSRGTKEYYAERAKRTQRFVDGIIALSQRYSAIATTHLRNARKSLQSSKAQQSTEEQMRVLHKLAVRLLNTLELHIMELCCVPRELCGALMTPLSVPGTWKRLRRECDERAMKVTSVALQRRVDIAALPPAPPDETYEQWLKRMNGLEDLYPPHLSDDTLRAVTCAEHYNLQVLVPLLRDEVSYPDDRGDDSTATVAPPPPPPPPPIEQTKELVEKIETLVITKNEDENVSSDVVGQ